MDDRFLQQHRRDPDPRFARDLRARLRAAEEPRPAVTRRWVPALAAAAVVVAVGALFAFPAVRASAQSMLDLFRVRRFAAVTFDAARAERLRELADGADASMLPFASTETLLDPGPARGFADADAAGAAAGLAVRRPTVLPRGLQTDSAFVQGAGAVRLTVSEARLRDLLAALELRDVAVPAGIDGQVLELRKPAMVVQRFRGTRSKAMLLQSESPEVALPPGLDLERLGEIGLRILGLDPGEARRVARDTDWRSTLMVPVPLNASTFRQVTVHGQPGLLITTAGRNAAGERRREGSVVLWSEDGRVYAVTGNLDPSVTVEMAESVR
jgi:hypothetical protein